MTATIVIIEVLEGIILIINHTCLTWIAVIFNLNRFLIKEFTVIYLHHDKILKIIPELAKYFDGARKFIDGTIMFNNGISKGKNN